MDNQQPRLEQSKVQRLSPRGVPDSKIIVIWETPPIQNKIFLYKLSSSKNSKIRYIGVSSNPIERAYNHFKDERKTHKKSWIVSLINKKQDLIMTVFKQFDSYEEALIEEEYFINTLDDLTNHVLNPTSPNAKKCYLYDVFTKEVISFGSLTGCANFIKTNPSSLLYNCLFKQKYLFSYNNDFDKILETKAKVIAKKNNKLKYFINYAHAAYELDCAIGSISTVLNEKRFNSINGWVLKKKDGVFPEKFGKHCVKVKCLNDDKIYNSIKEAAKFYSIDSSLITKCCKGKRKQTKGYRFVYFE